ncbi:MAG: hypothetical protein NTY15_00865 [Planctomycetota bacterium]|nr:hypothetical protein [Planctomycetota bacterium]
MTQNKNRKAMGFRFLFVCFVAISTNYFASRGNADDSTAGIGGTKSDQLSESSQEEKKATLDLIRNGKSSEITDDRAEKFVTMMRAQFPYESLRPRLAYETKLTKPQRVRKLSQVVVSDLIDYESKKGKGHRTSGEHVRPNSLELLHKETVRDFVARDGNGFGRTPPPSAIYLELTCNPPIPFDSVSDTSKTNTAGQLVKEDSFSGDFPSPYRSIEGDERRGSLAAHVANDIKRFAIEFPLMIPSRKFFDRLYQSTRDEFVSPRRSGHVMSVDQVSGFVPHRLDRRPQIEPWDYRSSILFRDMHLEKPGMGIRGNDKIDKEDLDAFREIDRTAPKDAVWLLRSLELVSLLQHDTPVAYVSSYLPDMEKLANVETRPLHSFEKESLPKLEFDEDLVIAARTNEIRLLGSIRASASCLKCHEVETGTLLGAFSYHLTRALPMKDRTSPQRGQQVERKP